MATIVCCVHPTTLSSVPGIFAALMNEFVMKWPIYIGGSADTSTGRQATWTTPKTIKVQFRSYSSSYDVLLHELYTWDGAVNTTVAKPKLSIKAIY